MIFLKKDKERAILANRHPWIFSGAIKAPKEELAAGGLVPLMTGEGKTAGWGFYSANSRIALRMVAYTDSPLPEDWLEAGIKNAFNLRNSLGINSNAYRLINAEGDFLPGLTVDVYNNTTVISPTIKGMELNTGRITAVLNELLPKNRIYIKRDEHTARHENIQLKNGFIHGEGPAKETIKEGDLTFHVDLAEGQQTGFYLDQRDNRSLLSTLSRGKKVINLFSYTGSFSLFGSKGGASKVVSVDTSKGALALAEKSRESNKSLENTNFMWINNDVFEYFKDNPKGDIIILDPPPLARKKGALPQALKGYEFLNREAIKAVNPKGGFVMTFSRSGALEKEMFKTTLFKAARKTNRNIRLVKELHTPADHPVSIFHPDGEYLKGWLLYVE